MDWAGVGGKALATVDFARFNPLCKPGPDFDACARERLMDSTSVVLAIVLFVGLSGFVVWFVITDQWFALGDTIRSWRHRKER